MPLIQWSLTLILLTYVLLLLSCGASRSMIVEGQLIYTGGGNSIEVISLWEKERNPFVIYEEPGIAAIYHITKMNDSVLFFDTCSGKPHCMIQQLNLSTKEVLVTRTGYLPQYISGHDQLFFYDQSADNGNWLFMATLADVNSITKIAKAPKNKTLPNGIQLLGIMPVVQISTDEVVFLNEEGQLTIYNIANAKPSPLGIDDCRPIFWRQSTQQLFCTNWRAKEPFLLDLHTRKKEKVSVLNNAYGFVYIAGLDSVIFGKTRSRLPFGESYDIFSYSFTENKESIVKKSSHIAAGLWMDGSPP